MNMHGGPELNSELREKLKLKYGREIIYVFSPELFENFNDQFTRVDEKFFREINGKGFFISRYMAEYNKSILQPIPYIVLVNEKTKKIFVTCRIGGEERLLNKFAFIGGHVDESDSDEFNIIRAAARRELKEEVSCVPASHFESLIFHGIIKDIHSSTADHVGFVFTKIVSDAEVLETDNLKGIWLSIDEAKEKIDSFESWAQIVIKNFGVEIFC